MDYKPDINIKQEKEEITEDKNDNYFKLCFDVRVKVENDEIIDNWSIQNLLASNTEFQETLCYKDIKQESLQICVLCQKYFSNSYSLFKHNLLHLKVPLIRRKLFMCEHCPNFYKSKNDLQNHIIIDHQMHLNNSNIPITKRTHKCDICNKTYSYTSWFSHINEVHGKLNLKCKKCNLKFKCKRYFKKHNMFHHDGVKRGRIIKCLQKTPVQCPKCPSVLDCKSALTTHLRNCHSDKSFTCHLCKSTLKCKSYLLAHLKRVHYNDGVIHQCDICGKEFKSPRYVKIHIKNSHYKTNKS